MEDQRTETPLAYHITWTAYGTWLAGDQRGWVARDLPEIQKPDPRREDLARSLMVEEAATLTPEQRDVVWRTIEDHCAIRRWTLHAVNVRTTHVHVVVTADRAPEDVMNQLKSWCSRRLNERWVELPRRRHDSYLHRSNDHDGRQRQERSRGQWHPVRPPKRIPERGLRGPTYAPGLARGVGRQ